MITSYNDTIAGIATAPGQAGVSIIRISGEQAISLVGSFFHPKNRKNIHELKNRYLTFGWIEKEGKTIDEAMICLMRKPNSFTTEDVVEIHCHGGMFLTQTVLELVLQSGARLSNPGEFTQRAFLNGRIDLTQAEATNDIIQAKSIAGLELVVNQLKGKLFEKISIIKEKISWVLSLINAAIDFPEEDTVFTNFDEISEKLGEAESYLAKLIASADTGIRIREGYHVVLTGHPNVGKSSLMNGLLEKPRAIVHSVPGTTRDTIEESFLISGIPVSLIDTAGIHTTTDLIEKEGIQRAETAVQHADLILWVLDATDPNFDTLLADTTGTFTAPVLLILNKKDLIKKDDIDIPQKWKKYKSILISALDDDDIQRLKNEIFEFISGKAGAFTEETMLTNLRQKISAEKAMEALKTCQLTLSQREGEELLAVDLSQTLLALGEIVGETTPDDMLNQIFAEFCIGK